MSSSSNITGLLAQLINGTTPTPISVPSTRNLNPVSFSTAYYKSNARAQEDRVAALANTSKKAIVLKHADDTPPYAPTTSDTNWYSFMNNMGPIYDLSDTFIAAATDTEITNYPKYYIWILPDNIQKTGVVPILINGNVININMFPLCSIKNTSITDSLVNGALVRIDFEDRNQREDAFVVSVMNNTEAFGRIVFTELEGIASPIDSFPACDEQTPAVSHPTGDTIPAVSSPASLHDAYMQISNETGDNMITEEELYDKLLSGLGDEKLALGILANAKAESALNANVVSGAATESSLGLWQFNVQSRGRVGGPKGAMRTQANSAGLPESIQIPDDAGVIRYYAGGLLATSKGVAIVSPADYANQDVSEIYETVTNIDNQVEYVIESARAMLGAINYNASEITEGQWAQWWQIYFEQPASIDDRASIASTLATNLNVAVV